MRPRLLLAHAQTEARGHIAEVHEVRAVSECLECVSAGTDRIHDGRMDDSEKPERIRNEEDEYEEEWKRFDRRHPSLVIQSLYFLFSHRWLHAQHPLSVMTLALASAAPL